MFVFILAFIIPRCNEGKSDTAKQAWVGIRVTSEAQNEKLKTAWVNTISRIAHRQWSLEQVTGQEEPPLGPLPTVVPTQVAQVPESVEPSPLPESPLDQPTSPPPPPPPPPSVPEPTPTTPLLVDIESPENVPEVEPTSESVGSLEPFPGVTSIATDASSKLVEERFWAFVDEWNGKYWIEPGIGEIECVGGVKLYLQEALGVEPLVWAPTDPNKGFPPLAIRDYITSLNAGGSPSIVQPSGRAVVPGYGSVPYQVELVHDATALQIGDIVFLGKTAENSWSNPGHTGIFARYGTLGTSTIVIFDQNGETGGSLIGSDNFAFHEFPARNLNEHAVGMRLVFEIDE
ncbi:MAG: hypothetical protein ACOCXQ_01575 [Patescibacteria group bacterium]